MKTEIVHLNKVQLEIKVRQAETKNFEEKENMSHAFRAIGVGREEVIEHWYDQLFLISHDVAFTEITDKVLEL